jgi:arylsulfatase
MPTGKNDVTVNFDYEGPGAGGAAKVSLVVNGSVAGEGRVQSSAPTLYTIDETFDVGIDRGSPVATYPESAGIGFAFTGGSIGGVTITAK